MKFNQIRYFLCVCNTLNFTKAAELCHISQPALSSAIKNLESQIGGSLFKRVGKTVQLTSLGVSMRTHLTRIDDARTAAELAAQSFINNSTEIIDLGLMCSLHTTELLSAISGFTEKYEGAEILIHDIWQPKALDLLVSGALDCILYAHTSPIPERFCSFTLLEDPMILAVGKEHILAKKNSITTNELHGETYIDRLRCEFREQFFNDIAQQNVHLNVIVRSEREDLIADFVSKNLGIAVMPMLMARQNNLATLEIEDLSIMRTLSIVTLEEQVTSPATRALMEQIKQAFQ